MEGSCTLLPLYKLIRKKKQITKSLPVINGPVSVKNGRAALKGKALISPGMKEVGPMMNEHKGLLKRNDVRNKVLLEERSDPHVDCKAKAVMGNQQGYKNSDLESDLRSGEDLCCTSNLENKLIISPKSLRKASRGQKQKKLWTMRSMDVEKRIYVNKQKLNSTSEQPSHKVLKDENRQFKHACPRMQTELKNNTAKDSRSSEEDLSSELSEYDNVFELDSDGTENLHYLMKTTKKSLQGKSIEMIQPYQCGNKHMEQQKAMPSMKHKILEVENLIHHVCTSLDCLKDSTHTSTTGAFWPIDSHVPTEHKESFPLELCEELKQTNIKSRRTSISITSSDAVATLSTRCSNLDAVSPPLSRLSSHTSRAMPQYRILPLPEEEAEDCNRIYQTQEGKYLYGSTEKSTYKGSESEHSVCWTPSSTPTIPTSPTKEESENRVLAEEKWPYEHIGNVSLCNSVSKNKPGEGDEIISTLLTHVSLDRDHTHKDWKFRVGKTWGG
ncbi:uncharacterized protein LOC113037916 [Carassius auratus]|uniref:Uncharacterized protein LOC113037916 n=1 Tax=Carassius auratus TaxID=7957 RepID=A0A6P6ITA9_CARAU|nr:uncharacterized protein LOC113037916 [Carassius auratus]